MIPDELGLFTIVNRSKASKFTLCYYFQEL